MTDVRGRIDATLDGKCPCGGEPRPGSAYCCDDCVPTHICDDTDTSGPGAFGAQSTAMRWRPDLVSEVDDSRLTLISQFRRGPYNAQLFAIADSDSVHCRLDDGNRFVGCDADGHQTTEGLEPVWDRLERELGNGRHVEADPWADVMRRYGHLIDDFAFGDSGIAGTAEASAEAASWTPGSWQRLCLNCEDRARPTRGQRTMPERLDIRFAPLDVEDCDLCGNCQHPFPGPPLQVATRAGSLSGSVTYRMRVGEFEARADVPGMPIVFALDSDVWIRVRLDRLEQQVLTEYARANLDRPDVLDWLEGVRQEQQRRSRAHMNYLRTEWITARVVDPRAILRNLSMY